jgi:hypothetical protein
MYVVDTTLNDFKTVLLNFLNIAKVLEVFIESEDSLAKDTPRDALDILNYSA